MLSSCCLAWPGQYAHLIYRAYRFPCIWAISHALASNFADTNSCEIATPNSKCEQAGPGCRLSAWPDSSVAASIAAVEPESCTQPRRDAFVCKCFEMIKAVRSSLLKLGAEVSPAAVVDQQWLSRTAVFMKFRRCAVNNLNRDCSGLPE